MGCFGDLSAMSPSPTGDTVVRRELIGVVSTLGAKDCTLDVPDKYTAVAKYLDWIKAC